MTVQDMLGKNNSITNQSYRFNSAPSSWTLEVTYRKESSTHLIKC